MNKANVILMAAGFGNRMRPLTETVPKPLIKVGHRSLIETVMDAFPIEMVQNFYIVTGYLGDQFESLLKKRKNICLIKNPDFSVANNLSSVFYARDVLKAGNCFICESDLLVRDQIILTDLPKVSCYFGKYIQGKFDDWGFDLDQLGNIKAIKKGCQNAYAMAGIAYFNAADAKILADCIEAGYADKGNRELFWDEIVDRNLDKLQLKIKEVKQEQIIEIDTVEELEAIYKKLEVL